MQHIKAEPALILLAIHLYDINGKEIEFEIRNARRTTMRRSDYFLRMIRGLDVKWENGPRDFDLII